MCETSQHSIRVVHAGQRAVCHREKKIDSVVFLAMVNQGAACAPKRWEYVDDVTAGESRTTLDNTPDLVTKTSHEVLTSSDHGQ